MLAIAIALTATHGVRANPPGDSGAESDPDVERARAAFRRGTELAKGARWPEAIEAFEESEKLRPHPITTYNLAYCERSVGHYARALRLFERALAEHGGPRGVLPESLLELSKQHRDEMRARVVQAHLVVVPAASNVTLDGHPLRARQATLDPGSHVFVVSHPGYRDQVITRAFARGEHATVRVSLTRPTPATPRRNRPEPPLVSERGFGAIALGVGAAGVLIGSIFGLEALEKRRGLSSGCGPTRDACPPNRQGDIDAMNRDANISTGAFAVGALGIGLGTYLWFDAPSPTRSRVGGTLSIGGAF